MDLLTALYVYFARPLLTLLFFVILIWVVVGWLVQFGVINTRNSNARMAISFLNSIVEPMCRPIRRFIPPLGGVLDLSPMIVVLGILFVRDWGLPQLLSLAARSGGA